MNAKSKKLLEKERRLLALQVEKVNGVLDQIHSLFPNLDEFESLTPIVIYGQIVVMRKIMREVPADLLPPQLFETFKGVLADAYCVAVSRRKELEKRTGRA